MFSVVRLGWEESRPIVQIVFHLRLLTAVLLVDGATAGSIAESWGGVFAGGAAWVLTTVAIYLYNGVGDVSGDRVNGSSRPLADGRLALVQARVMVVCAAAGAMTLTVITPVSDTALVMAMLGLGWLYSRPSRPWKASVGGAFVVCVGGGVLTYAAGWQLGGAVPPIEAIVFAVAMSLWMGMAGSTKDLADVAGDRLAGRRTLPVLVGPERARRTIAVGVGALSIAQIVAISLVGPYLIPAAAVLLTGAAILVAFLLRPGPAEGVPRSPYRTFMITQYLVHVVAIGVVWLS